MKLRKGDTVKVIAGGNSKKNNDKGKIGEILKVNAKDNTVVVEGVNIVTKHNRPTNANPDGGIEKKEAPIHISNVAYFDPVEKKPTRIGYKVENGKKVRYCKLSNTVIK